MKKLLVLLLVLLMVVPVMAQEGEGEEPLPPRQAYLVCDWGLLTIEEPAEPESPFITITSPQDYSPVQATFSVSGEGQGLFEGSVIVEVGFEGDVELAFSGTTTLQAEELGEVGEWSIEVPLDEMEEATEIFVSAYSLSPEDGAVVAFDSIRLNAGGLFPLPFVEIARPYFGQGVSTSPLLIEGFAAGAFENNVAIEVRDFETKAVLAETSATIEADELGAVGPFMAEVMLELEPGQSFEVYAYHPPVEDDAEISVDTVQFALADPLGRTYDRFLTVQRDDPIYGAEDVCAQAEAEFENEATNLLLINDVQVLSTRSMMPLVHVDIQAAGSSVCPAPLRTRITRDGDAFAIEIYYDATRPVPCTLDLAPIPQRVSLGTLESPDFTITVNGEAVE